MILYGHQGKYVAKTITDRDCQTSVEQLTKIYDNKCPGFFVQITKAGEATFYFRYRDRQLGNKQLDIRLGVYVKHEFNVLDARAQAFNYRSRADQGESIALTKRKATETKRREGKTVDDIIEAYIAFIQVKVEKPDGEMRPRIESWEQSEGYLRRFTSVALGKRLGWSVDNNDIANVSNDIVVGKYGKPSISNARHFRTVTSAMFTWAAKPGRELGVKFNPVHNLEALDKEKPRERILSAAEIKTLWWGLDHPNVPCSRQIALALKFELVTMLRSKEYLTAEPPEFLDLGNDNARFVIPMKRVKKRRTLIVPMSLLAQEIILLARASKGGSQPYVFPGKFDGKPLDDEALGHAVRGLTNRKTGKVVRRGICHFLGMAPWTPHDLRRTAATLAGDLGFSEARIAQCLDHRIQHGDDAVPTVTGVYVHSKRIIEKKEVLDAVAAELRRIIGLPPARQQPAQKLKLVG